MEIMMQEYFKKVVAAAVLALIVAGCGGGSSSPAATPQVMMTVPLAPSIVSVDAGNATATVKFNAPTDNGGATISSYAVSCSSSRETKTATGTASPITVTNLENDTSYACSITATSSVGTSRASAEVLVSPFVNTNPVISTSGVACDYNHDAFNNSPSVNLMSIANWSCGAQGRVLAANGIPDHDVGTFPNANNPNTIAEQSISANFTLSPDLAASATALGGPRGVVGYVLNGVKIDAGTAGSCSNAGANCSLVPPLLGDWSIEALGQTSFDFGDDDNHAHVQPGGEYHYHGIPEGFVSKLNMGAVMTLIGWSADGFPIYARYGHQDAMAADSEVVVIESSYRVKTSPDANRPAIADYPLGTFTQDYEYVAGIGSGLDECNGRQGVTPEFPEGIYHYYATDGFPFLQRCIKGDL